tara:strand:+ start:176 stop:1372 length:1197 start_codon:yes stop_codon:yes gene_type:complete
MLLANFLSKLFKEDGIILIDSTGQKYICGNPNNAKPLTLKLKKKDLNWKLLIRPELYLGEEYFKHNIDIENGSIYDFLCLCLKNIGRGEINIYSSILNKFLLYYKNLTSFNNPVSSKKNIQHHYDRGEDLYNLFLDKKHKLYSCAYFKSDNESLEDAQENKINHLIKKLYLKPNLKVLEIGSGWGGLCFDIARKSQCEVVGITLSQNQLEQSRKKAKELKLDNQVSFELCDYREMKGKFDRIINVGMLEHVHPKYYDTFFKKISELMKDDGICLTHTIGSTNPPGSYNEFINKYIFPGGKVPSLSQLIPPIEKYKLVLSDCESLIRHYDKTLKAWLDRLVENREKVKNLFDKQFFRLFEFYLSSCSAAFTYSDLLVYQLQIVKSYSALPSNRRDYIYQ